MLEWIIKRISNFPKSTICDERDIYTYQQFGNLVEKKAKMIDMYFRGSLKCAVLCRNALNEAIGILAAWSCECTVIPLSIDYGSMNVERILDLVHPKLLIVDKEILLEVQKFKSEQYDILVIDLEEKLLRNEKKYVEIINNIAAIMCTSGTTGYPKGAMLSEENITNNLFDIANYFPIGESDTILIARPLYHCAVLTGEFLLALVKGVNIVFFNQGYHPMGILSCLQKYKITTLCGTPTLFFHLSQFISHREKVVSLRLMAISGECLDSNVAKKIRNAFPNTDIYNVYGLTEASPRVAALPPNFFDKYPDTVGFPLSAINIKVVDKYYKEVANGQDGRLLVKGPNIMKGYYQNIELTRKVLIDGWLDTGDIACINEQGLLVIKCRADDMIIKGGMNIYPKEIEKILIQEDFISEVVAYEIKKEGRTAIGIEVVLKDSNFSQSEVVKICREKLPEYMCPEQVLIVDHIAYNASGKVNRASKKLR